MKFPVGKSLAVGMVLGSAAYALTSTVVFPTPITSVSALTVAATDSAAVIVRYTRRCVSVAGVNVCPALFDVRLEGNYGIGYAQLSRRTRSQLADTIRFQRPLCPDTLRVRGEVSAIGQINSARSRTGFSLWQVVRCSNMTAAEKLEAAAMVDSFPQGSRRITTGDVAIKLPKDERDVMLLELLRASKTKADSVKHQLAYARADSMPNTITHAQPTDTLVAMIGFKYQLCFLARNRYTGAVVLLDGDATSCEAPRLRMQQERSG